MNSQTCDLANADPSLTDILEKFKQCCTICHLNVRSLLGHFDELHEVIRSTDGKTAIFTLSETWLDARIPDGVVTLPGYRIFRKDRNTVGGVAVYCPDTLRCKRHFDLELDCMEALWVEIFCKGKKPTTICHTIVYFGDRSKDKVEEILTNELDMVATWIQQNGLSMNPEKTQFTCLARRRKSGEANQLNIMVNGESLVKSKMVKYLRVYVDSSLKWDKHISYV